MSLKTWKKEFYPVSAKRCAKSKALEYTLLKWTGLLPKNRKKHGCRLDRCTLLDSEQRAFHMNIDSCVLCYIYNTKAGCHGCPLDPCSGYTDTPFSIFAHTGSVTPMIKHIKAAMKKAGK